MENNMTERLKYKGENGIIVWPLLQRNGEPLPIDSLTMLYVEFIQYNRVKQKYIYLEGSKPIDPEIRVSDLGENIVEIEYTTALTEELDDCTTYLKLTLEVVDPEMSVENELHAEFVRYVFTIIR
jgi:hypothetical protein